MYPPPQQIDAEVFAELPAGLDRSGEPAPWTRQQLMGAEVGSFLEGPSFDRDGNLYVVDIAFGRVFRVSPKAAFETVADYDGWPNGLKIHRDGRIFIADHMHGIMTLDPATGAVEPFLVRPKLESFKGVNDLVFASNGDLYFTDQGQTGLQDPTGRVYRLTPDGRLDLLLDNVPSPNGLVLSPEEDLLFLAVTRANAIWRLPLLPDGTTTKVGLFIQLSGGGGPDGLAMDQDGNLAVAHFGLGSVWLFSRFGEPLYRIVSPAGRFTTNIAYGGPDRRHLYITESRTGSILLAELPVPGRTMFSHMD